MGRTLFNATIVPEIVKLIAKEYSLTENEALDRWYTSLTAKLLNDPECGLYGQSALFIFSQYLDEMKTITEDK